MTPLEMLGVFAAGVGAGAMNAVVGSGTLITFPVLLATGLSPVTATVSNALGLIPGSISGAIGYRRELAGQGRRVRKFAVGAVLGGFCGAILLLALPAAAFEAIVPTLVGLALLLVALQPLIAKKVRGRRARVTPPVPTAAGRCPPDSPWPVSTAATSPPRRASSTYP
ncbi:hypothetical protein SHKM778_51590 [Streptomyces sp. KM77-8]|uniref:Probable membrane transporter protein n=1 Tax=Streptomyces haneummycinicus TaxID=3074435 RepID=A0AAT9HN69_9ACTN